tara:strand:+ start:709 stop:900 length:192 start_codon:yes stop_codon:yes gene_type:complete
MILLLTLFACGEGIVPLPANETSQIDAVILCQEGITINWGTPGEMKNKFNEAMAELDLCERTN